MPPLMDISVIPVGKEGASLGDTVVEVLRIAEKHGIQYELSPMSTTMEGDLDTLLQVAREMHEVCFGLGYPRVLTAIRVAIRRHGLHFVLIDRASSGIPMLGVLARGGRYQ